jgi:hypothetical protein
LDGEELGSKEKAALVAHEILGRRENIKMCSVTATQRQRCKRNNRCDRSAIVSEQSRPEIQVSRLLYIVRNMLSREGY